MTGHRSPESAQQLASDRRSGAKSTVRSSGITKAAIARDSGSDFSRGPGFEKLTWAFGPPAHDENQIEHSGISLHPKAHITADIFRTATGTLHGSNGARFGAISQRQEDTASLTCVWRIVDSGRINNSPHTPVNLIAGYRRFDWKALGMRTLHRRHFLWPSACILDGGKRHNRTGAARQTAASAI